MLLTSAVDAAASFSRWGRDVDVIGDACKRGPEDVEYCQCSANVCSSAMG